MTGTLLLELEGSIDPVVLEKRKKRMRSLVDWFEFARINFTPTADLARAFRGPVVLVDTTGKVKPATSAYQAGDAIRAHYSPSIDQTRIAIDVTPAYEGGKTKLQASGFRYHYLEAIKDDDKAMPRAMHALKERSFAAIIMAQNAHAMGWTRVDTTKTQDPVERYILELACQYAGLQVKQPVDITQIPPFLIFHDDEKGEQVDKVKNTLDMSAQNLFADILVQGDKAVDLNLSDTPVQNGYVASGLAGKVVGRPPASVIPIKDVTHQPAEKTGGDGDDMAQRLAALKATRDRLLNQPVAA